MHRTIQRRPSVAATLACVLLAALLGATAHAVHAADAGLELAMTLVASSPHAPAAPPDLHIATTWPDACLPSIERVSMLPGHVDITLRATRRNCARTPTPLELSVNPARAAGWTNFPASVYEVRLFLQDGERPAELIGFHWLDANGGSGPVHPENGFWWPMRADSASSVMSGSSITLERQGDRIAVTLLGYERGTPTWYFGSADLLGSTARMHLMRMLGGADAFDPPAEATVAEPGPVLHLHFSSPARAQAWIERPLHGSARAIELQSLALMRLAFVPGRSGEAWRGTWVLVRTDSAEAHLTTLSTARTSDADAFRLADDASGEVLECRYAEPGDDVVPSSCTLSRAGTLLALFDRVGLDRFDGRTPDGAVVRLVRIPD